MSEESKRPGVLRFVVPGVLLLLAVAYAFLVHHGLGPRPEVPDSALGCGPVQNRSVSSVIVAKHFSPFKKLVPCDPLLELFPIEGALRLGVLLQHDGG